MFTRLWQAWLAIKSDVIRCWNFSFIKSIKKCWSEIFFVYICYFWRSFCWEVILIIGRGVVVDWRRKRKASIKAAVRSNKIFTKLMHLGTTLLTLELRRVLLDNFPGMLIFHSNKFSYIYMYIRKCFLWSVK